MSKLAIGTANFGLKYGINNINGRLSEKEIVNILKLSAENGINFIDTAQAYGDAEERLGKIFANLPYHFNVITKLTSDSLIGIEELFDKSYYALNLKSIYAVLYHDFKFFINNPESKDVIEKKKNQGKVGKIGFSLYFPSELEYLLKNKISFDIVQIPYNIFDRRFEYLFPELKRKGIEIHSRSVFLQGLMFKNPNSLTSNFNKAKEKIVKLKNLSEKTGSSIAGICLNFVINNKYIDKVVIGVDSAKQLQQNINQCNKSLMTPEVNKELSMLKIDDENVIIPFNWEKNQ